MISPTAQSRGTAVRLVLYNHKGGVGKTTLTVNIASALVAAGKRVLLVDTDPQCNITSYLVEANVVNKWLDESDTVAGVTIWSAIRPVTENTGPIKSIKPIERIKGIYLIPGDIRLSEFEQDLNQIWIECLQRKVHGFKGSSAISDLVGEAAAKVGADYVFYDVGPNIGPLNRVILLDCDYFIVPAACDLFSTRALSTLGHSLASWIRDWEVITQLAPDNIQLLPGKPKFLGYVLQKFRVYGGEISGGYSKYAVALERAVHSDVAAVLRKVDKELASTSITQNKLGQVKDFGQVAAQAQSQGVAFESVTGAAANQKEEARREFGAIARKIIQRTSMRL